MGINAIKHILDSNKNAYFVWIHNDYTISLCLKLVDTVIRFNIYQSDNSNMYNVEKVGDNIAQVITFREALMEIFDYMKVDKQSELTTELVYNSENEVISVAQTWLFNLAKNFDSKAVYRPVKQWETYCAA